MVSSTLFRARAEPKRHLSRDVVVKHGHRMWSHSVTDSVGPVTRMVLVPGNLSMSTDPPGPDLERQALPWTRHRRERPGRGAAETLGTPKRV